MAGSLEWVCSSGILHGLPAGQRAVVLWVGWRGNGRPATVKQMCHEMGLGKSAAYEQVAELVGRGVLERVRGGIQVRVGRNRSPAHPEANSGWAGKGVRPDRKKSPGGPEASRKNPPPTEEERILEERPTDPSTDESVVDGSTAGEEVKAVDEMSPVAMREFWERRYAARARDARKKDQCVKQDVER